MKKLLDRSFGSKNDAQRGLFQGFAPVGFAPSTDLAMVSSSFLGDAGSSHTTKPRMQQNPQLAGFGLLHIG
jgi:hypothetical protein